MHIHERARREWKSAPLGTTPVVITMDSPKVKCLRCFSKTWHQPTFASGQLRVTKTFEKTLDAWLSKLTLQDAATMFGVAWHTVYDVDLARLRKLPRPQLSEVKRLAIDENYLGTRHGFVTIVLDLDTKAIVSVTKGCGQAALDQFFSTLKRSKANIEAVATDMAGGYIAAVQKHLSKAALVFDPPKDITRHVVKLMNEKLTALRREMYHELTDKMHKQVLKGTRWLSSPWQLRCTSAARPASDSYCR